VNTHDLDTPCGYCDGCGGPEIPRGRWTSAPACAQCGGSGYLITSPDAERLLAFVLRHLPLAFAAPEHPREEGGVTVHRHGVTVASLRGSGVDP
jgi:hypothetical protein